MKHWFDGLLLIPIAALFAAGAVTLLALGAGIALALGWIIGEIAFAIGV